MELLKKSHPYTVVDNHLKTVTFLVRSHRYSEGSVKPFFAALRLGLELGCLVRSRDLHSLFALKRRPARYSTRSMSNFTKKLSLATYT